MLFAQQNNMSRNHNDRVALELMDNPTTYFGNKPQIKKPKILTEQTSIVSLEKE